MEESVNGLTEALALEPREHLALVGGGGKTSLMFALAEELSRKKRRIVTSTTTKIWHQEALSSSCVIFTQSSSTWMDNLREGLKIHGHVFLTQNLLDSGKVRGISSSLADDLYQDHGIDYMLVEADGSARHPVKAHAENEPVIPASVTKVVAMLGLEALGKQMVQETVFRVDSFQKLTGLKPGQKLTTPVLAKLFLDPGGLFKGTPQSAKRVVFLNKLDLLSEEREAMELANLIIDDPEKQIDRV
ncbi:MAG: putative selenium-dependent hydroxylase accessory protein YqeC, partial [Deltaproteobacteria bacterium]|nr:putative selenium-dependent hydroxylase accessory protein YqeC [Deltaproteobacteria bacterium]